MTRPLTTAAEAVTYVQRTTGASAEDAERVVQAVATFAVAQYMATQPAPQPQGVTMEQVKAYVDGRLEGKAPTERPLWWALDTLMREYEDGGTFEDLSADIRRILREWDHADRDHRERGLRSVAPPSRDPRGPS